MPDVIDKKRIRDLIKMKNIPQSNLTSLCNSLAMSLGGDTKELGFLYRTSNGAATVLPVCLNPRVQRLSLYDQLPLSFDENVESNYISGIIIVLSPVVQERMRVGFAMILRNPIFKISVGLRLKRMNSMNRSPNNRPPIDSDAHRVNYDPSCSIQYFSSMHVSL